MLATVLYLSLLFCVFVFVFSVGGGVNWIPVISKRNKLRNLQLPGDCVPQSQIRETTTCVPRLLCIATKNSGQHLSTHAAHQALYTPDTIYRSPNKWRFTLYSVSTYRESCCIQENHWDGYTIQSGSTEAHTVFSLDLHSHTVLSWDLQRLTPSSVWIYREWYCPLSGSKENDIVLYLDLKRMILSSIWI